MQYEASIVFAAGVTQVNSETVRTLFLALIVPV